MNNRHRQSLGKKGEEIAARYLSANGVKVIEKNFHKRYSEIDIVGLEGKTLVFIEVKTRIGTKFGLPEEAITPWKLHSLVKSAQYYKLLHSDLPEAMRIDVVTILFSSDERVGKVAHYKNVTGY